MTTETKAIIAAVLAVIIGVAIYGGYQYPQVSVLAGSSPTGSTFSSAKVAEITMAPISASATSSSILNTDASDRIIDSEFVSCATSSGSVFAQTSAGVASWQWTFATTSTAAPATFPATANNAALLTVATSTTDNEYIASSTSPAKVMYRTWLAGSYLTIMPNATSSTALLQCQAGVYYHAS